MCENQKPRFALYGSLSTVVDEAVMRAVLRGPDQDAVLQRHGAEQHQERAHRPVRAVGAMRPQAVVACRDRDAACPQ